MTDRPDPDGPMLDAPVKSPVRQRADLPQLADEAAYRMIQNNLDPRVPTYSSGLWSMEESARPRATGLLPRDCVGARGLEEDETLLWQSVKPVGVVRTHAERAAC